MNSKRKQICRLCLEIAKEEVWIIDELVKQTFDVFLLKFDFGVTRDPIVCQSCVEIVKKCLSFKSTCINAEKTIVSFSIVSKNNNHSIKDIYKEMERLVKVDDENLDICRFCLARLRRKNVIPLGMLMNDTMFEMLIENMPELDFVFIDAPIICKTCSENLEEYFKFIQNSLEVEEKIRGRVRAYCMKEGTVGVGQVKLDMFHFLFKDILEYPNKCQQICETEGESNIYKDTPFLYPEAHSELIKNDIKEEINLQEDYQAKQKSRLTEHMMIHKNVSKIKTFKCALCPYEAKQKSILKRHMLVHKDVSEVKMYKCSLCAYETKYKHHLKRHMSVHKDISETIMYKCSKCSFCVYQVKPECTLTEHMTVHRCVSETKMYKCSLCPYETKQKTHLEEHKLVHKDFLK